VLEIAAGTGAATRAMAARLGDDVAITATDLNPPMLERAASQQEKGRVTWRQADALALPFDDASFDAVACQFGAMFFPDKVKGYAEARRVLKPAGRYVFSVWDRLEDNEFTDVVTDALATVFPQDPPRFMARTPHGYFDAGLIRSQLGAAGFRQITVDTVSARSRADSAHAAAVAICQGSPLRNEIEARDPKGLERATQAAADLLARRFGSGPIEGKIQALVATAQG
jgi:SAM-dependent methyltransferase